MTVADVLNVSPASAGVVSDGLVPNTSNPDPVSSAIDASRFALDGVPRKVATPEPRPLIPEPTGNPVQLVSVPLVGVPRTGVTRVGVLAKTSAPVPVSSEITPASWDDVVDANWERGFATRASPPPEIVAHVPSPLRYLVASPEAGAGTKPFVPPEPESPTIAFRMAVD